MALDVFNVLERWEMGWVKTSSCGGQDDTCPQVLPSPYHRPPPQRKSPKPPQSKPPTPWNPGPSNPTLGSWTPT